MNALGGATEFQGHGTPHFHAEGHLTNCYQYGTLAEIAAKLRSGEVSAENCKAFQAWLHKEVAFDEDMHAAFEPDVYKQWQERFAGWPEHGRCSGDR